MKPILEIQHISKKYKLRGQETPYLTLRDALLGKYRKNKKTDEFWALNDVNFHVYPGESVGIIGKNGAGKSTLLKILSRITPPTKGKIIARGRIASLLEVGTGFHAELTGMENIFLNGSILGLRKTEIKAKLDEIIDFAGVEKFIDTPLKHYSSGMQLRLAFAVAAHLEPEILIIDEVLAVGDAEFQKKSLGKMEDVTKQGRTVLFVSHNMSAVKRLCNKSILLDNGVVKQEGDTKLIVDEYLKQKNVKNIAFYNEEVIKKIEVYQDNNIIKIKVNYSYYKEIKQPNLGFVIYDVYDNPITGTNPLKSGVLDFGSAKKEGNVEVEISCPLLADGNYNLSIWFNDGAYNRLFYKHKCVSLEVKDMIFYNDRNNNIEGYVVPICNWKFNN